MNSLSLRDQHGQMTLEMTLIIVALLSVAMIFSKAAQDNEWMQTLVSGPWKPVKAMIENGTWIAANSNAYNPSLMSRHGSYRGDDVQGMSDSTDPGQ